MSVCARCDHEISARGRCGCTPASDIVSGDPARFGSLECLESEPPMLRKDLKRLIRRIVKETMRELVDNKRII